MKKTLLIFIFVLQVVIGFAQNNENEELLKAVPEGRFSPKSAAARAGVNFLDRLEKIPGKPFKNSLRGNIVAIGNSILSKHKSKVYDGTSNNNHFKMVYVDIDGDSNTFSSSSATLNPLKDCSKIVYAGLYWAGTGTGLSNVNKVKFKKDGDPYTDLVADKIVHKQSDAYVCYKDVTNMVTSAGRYFTANVKAKIKSKDEAAGWSMVIIYEDDTETSKKFFIFDGFKTISGSDKKITINGFKTPAVGPVRVGFITSTLEGDRGYKGDDYKILKTAGNQYVSMSDKFNYSTGKSTNFFRSGIDTPFGSRTPNSSNNLGFDLSQKNIPPAWGIFANNQSEIEIKFTTNGDVYYPFLNAMAVEVVEPDIELVMTVDDGDAASNNLAGATRTLGDKMWYHIDFRNKGTDSATNTIIRDQLPLNVSLVENTTGGGVPFPNGKRYEVELSPGIEVVSYMPPGALNGYRAVIEYKIDDDILEVKVDDTNGVWTFSPKSQIRMMVQVEPDCQKLVSVCSNKISNSASVSTTGRDAGAEVGQGSSQGYDSCSHPVKGETNILVNIDDCASETRMCGIGVTLTAGIGYETYSWTKDGIPVSSITGPNQDSNPQTYFAASPGVYKVSKVASAANGCLNMQEIITVEPFSTTVNPLIKSGFSNAVLSCSSNNEDQIVEVYLCGGVTKTIQLSFASSTTVLWEKLKDSATPNPDTNCATTTAGAWEPYTDGANASISLRQSFKERGQYRLVVTEGTGCWKRYYFNVYEGGATPTVVPKNIYCGAPGSITVNDVPSGFKYALASGHITAIPTTLVRGFQDSNVFENITVEGQYTVFIESTKTTCISHIQTKVNKININVTVKPKPILCSSDIGGLSATINSDIPEKYHYKITKGSLTGTSVDSKGPTTDKSFSADISTSGDYYVTVWSDSESKCRFESKKYNFRKPDPVKIGAVKTKDIICGDGLITFEKSGGTPGVSSDYTVAIIKYVPTPSDATVTKAPIDIPQNPTVINQAYLNQFDIIPGNTLTILPGEQGTYTFVIFDSNNCMAISNEVTVAKNEDLKFKTDFKDITCTGISGVDNGEIKITTLDPPGLQGFDLEYSIDGKLINDTTKLYQNSNIFNNLSEGTYKIDIRATKGGVNGNVCHYDKTVKISTTPQATGKAKLTQDLDCNQTATITFDTPTGGNGAPYTYGITNTGVMSFDGNKIKAGLASGTYELSIKDKEGCETKLDNIVIKELAVIPPYTEPVEITYGCDGKGRFTLVPTKPTKPADLVLTYTLKDSDGVEIKNNSINPKFLIGYPEGAYVVSVSAPRACPVDVPVKIENEFFTGKILNHTDATCHGSDDGKISIVADNYADGKFEYSTDGGGTWNWAIVSPGTTFDITGLAGSSVGTGKEYTVSIRKDGCKKDIGKQKIKEPVQLIISHDVKTDPTCLPGGDKAVMTVSATGGTKPYQFSTDGGATWSNQTNDKIDITVSQGDVDIIVKDANGCTLCGCDGNSFANGDFEEFPTGATAPPSTWKYNRQNTIPGWSTTEMVNGWIESWKTHTYNGVTTKAHEGNYFMELNSDSPATLYQDFCTQEGDIITWSVAHRGRKGIDKATVIIGGTIGTASIEKTMSTDRNAWKEYSGTYIVPANQSTTLIGFNAISSSTGNVKEGNFIDAVKISVKRPGCAPVKINIPEAPKPSVTVNTQTECYKGDGKAEIKVTASGGSPNYLFSKDDGVTWETPSTVSDATYTFTNLAPANNPFKIKVKDSKGCEGEAAKSVTLPTQVVASLKTNSPVTCSSGGRIEINASGGTAPLVYAFIKGPNSPNTGDFKYDNFKEISSSEIGTYNIYVRDNAGGTGYCEAEVKNIEIVKTPKPTVTVTPTNPSCDGGVGSFTVKIEGGKEKYTVAVTTETTKTDVSAGTLPYTGKAEGTYTVTVIDANGCDVEKKVTLTAPDPLDGSVTLSQDYTCKDKGIIAFTAPTGGTAPYKYSIDNGANYYDILASQFSGLVNGTFTPIIKDKQGCTQSLAAIKIKPLPVIPAFTYDDAYDCEGKGIITLKRTDGSTDLTGFTFKEEGKSDNGSNVFTGLSVGTHKIIVSQARACDITVSVEVKAGKQFTASLVSTATTPVLCKGGTTGTATIQATFFGNAYIYEVLDSNSVSYQTSEKTTSPYKIEGLKVDTYTIKVYPKGNTNTACVESFSVTIEEPTAKLVAVVPTVVKEITCFTPNNASITGNATGGTTPYTFTVLKNKTGPIITDLTDIPSGTHTLLVVDDNDCEDQIDFTIHPAKKPTHTAAVADCYKGTNLDIAITAADGKAPYTFSIDNGVTWSSPVSSTDLSMNIPAGPGTHQVIVKDANGCKSVMSEVVIKNQLTGSTVSTKNVTCNAGEIVVKAEEGHGTYSFELFKASSSTPVDSKPANGTAQATFTIADGDEGTYRVVVKDAKNCEYPIENITINKIITATAVATPTQPKCHDDLGSIDLTITNGLAPFVIKVAGGAGATAVTDKTISSNTLNIPNLGTGDYVITIIDKNECETKLTKVSIQVPSTLSGTAVKDLDYTCDQKGTIVFAPSAGTPPYKYSIDNGMNWENTVTFNVDNGTYKPIIKDKNNCELKLTAITFDPLPVIPAFTDRVTYTCDGKGDVVLTPATGIASDYTYSIVGTNTGAPTPDSSADGTFTGLVSDTYTVTVKQTRACDRTVTFTVNDKEEFTANLSGSKTDVKCKGDSTGEITFEADKYTRFGGEFYYTVDGGSEKSSTTSSVTVTGLVAGAHNIKAYVKVSGAEACPITITETLTEPTIGLSVGKVNIIKEITCVPNTGATIEPILTGATATAIGGTPSYTYEIKHASTSTWTSVLTDIPVGTHEIRVTDANNCTKDGTFTILDKKPVVFSATPTLCFEGAGEVVVDVTNGNGNYEFSLTGGVYTGQFKTPAPATPNTYTFPNLQPDIEYTVQVKDGRGCLGTEQKFKLDKQLLATPKVFDVSCEDGKITLDIKGGKAPYEYIFESEDTSKVIAPTSGYGSFTVNYEVATAVAGKFDIWIKDSKGCTVKVPSIEVKNIPSLDFELTGDDAQCAGDFGKIKVEIPTTSIGIPPYAITVTDNNGLVQEVPGSAAVFGHDGTTEVTALTSNNVFELFNLPSGLVGTGLEYTVKVVDAYKCEKEYKIKLSDAPNLDISVASDLPKCDIKFADEPENFGFYFTGKYDMTADPLPTVFPALPTLPIPVTGGTYKLEFSKDGGNTWQDDKKFTHIDLGVRVYPAVKISHIAADGTKTQRCIKILPSYVIPYKPITLVTRVILAASGDCSKGADAIVTIDPTFAGSPNYQYGYNTVPVVPIDGSGPGQFGTPVNSLTATFTNLEPRRQYYFFVKDSRGCIGMDDSYLDTYPVSVEGEILKQGCVSDGGQFKFTITDPTDLFGAVSVSQPINWVLYTLDSSGNGTPVDNGTTTSLVIEPGINNIPRTTYGEGIYYITVQHGKNSSGIACSPVASKNFEIRASTAITGDTEVIKNVACTGKKGKVKINNVSGGYGNYSYAIGGTGFVPNISDFSHGNPIEVITAGTYDVWAKDGNDCKYFIDNFTIKKDPEPVLEDLVVNNCSTNKTIIATAYSTDASKAPMVPIKFSIESTNKKPIKEWTGSVSTIVADKVTYTYNNLEPKDKFTAEEYTLTVIDKNGCESNEKKATIYPDLIFEAAVNKNLDCSATSNAKVLVKITSGAGKYKFEATGPVSNSIYLSGGSTSDWTGNITVTTEKTLSFDVTTPGEYTIKIDTDNTLRPTCPVIQKVTVDPKVEPDFTKVISDVTCNGGSNGKIVISTTKGITPVMYTLTQTAGVITYTSPAPSTNTVFDNLPAGTYTIKAKAANECTKEEFNIIIKEPTVINIVDTNVATKQFVCTSGNTKVNASIDVKIAAIATPSTVTPSTRTITKVIFYKGSLTGTEVQNSTNPNLVITDISGGDYYVKVFDNKGCSGTYGPVTIKSFNKLDKITINKDQPIYCGVNNGEQITVGVDTTIPVSLNPITNVDITVQGPTGSDYATAVTKTKSAPYTEQFVNLTEGEYTITVKNNDTGCELVTKHLVGPTPSDQYQVNVNVTDKFLCTTTGTDSEVKFNLSSNYTGKYTYKLFKGIAPSGTQVTATGILATAVMGEQTLTNVLDAGDYYIEATMVDKPYCPVTSSKFTIKAPTVNLVASGSPTAPKCNGGLGSITVENDPATVGGYGNYEFMLLASDGTTEVKPYQSSTLFTSLAVGKYFIKVKDINGCDDISDEIEITNPDVVTLSYVFEDNSCDDTTKAKITLTGSGGTGSGYNYKIQDDSGNDQSNTSGEFTNLNPGTYKLFVQDANGCVGSTNGEEITIGKPLAFTLNKDKNIDCSTNPKGKVVLNITSGTGKYAYQVNGSGLSTVPYTKFTSIGATTSVDIDVEDSVEYTVVVYDLGNRPSRCDKQEKFKLAPKLEPIFTATPIDATCFEAKNGKIVLAPTDNGILPLEYTIDPVPSGYTATITGNVFENLPPDTYSVTGVSTTNSCPTTVNNIIVGEPDQITFTRPSDAKFECAVGTNNPKGAVITIDKTTLSPAITIVNYTKVEFIDSNNVIVQTGPSFEYTSTEYGGMIYTVKVYNDKGCFGKQTAEVLPYNALDVATVSATKVIDCNTGEDIEITYTSNPVNSIATADFTINNVAGTFTYAGTEDNIGEAKGVFTKLLPDTYIITVTNPDTGCSITTTHLVKEKPKYELAVTTTEGNVCTLGAATGEISFDFTDASPDYTGAYTYNVFDFGTPNSVANGSGIGGTATVVTGLKAGDYEVEIDMGGSSPFCKGKSEKFTINQPTANLDVALTETAPTCIGDSDGIITAVGVGGYGSYEYSLTGMGVTIPYRSSGVFGGLKSGKYTVGIKDANSCESTKDIDFKDPTPVTFTTVKLDNVCDAEGGKITVTALGGNTTTYNYYITSSTGIVQSKIGVVEGVFNELNADVYTVSVENTTGCNAANTEDITIHPDFEFTVSKSKLIDCKPGNAGFGTVEIAIVKGSGNYAYEVTGAVTVSKTTFTGTSTTFDAPAVGTYTVKVYDTDAKPECDKVSVVEFEAPIEPNVTLEQINITCKGDNDGRIIVTALDNGTLPLEYTIEPAHGTGFIAATSSFDGLKPNENYIVKVKSTTNACVFASNAIVLTEPSVIDVPNTGPNKAINVTQFACSSTNEFNNAKIEVDLTKVTGGTKTASGSYVKVEIIDQNNTIVLSSENDFDYTVTDKLGGTYTIMVYDAHNCVGTNAVVIDPFNELDKIQITQTKAITCDTGENIKVGFTSNPVGSITTADFTITNGDKTAVTAYPTAISGSTAQFDNLAPGLYIVTVTDPDTDCSINEIYQVKEEPKFNLIVKTIKGSVCSSGGSDGVVSVDFAKVRDNRGTKLPSYTGAYTYTVFDAGTNVALTPTIAGTGTGGTPVKITGLPEGEFYVVAVMNDAPRCETKSTNISIVKPDVLISVAATTNLISCTDANSADGEIVITGAGGFGGYTYKVVRNASGGTPQVTVQEFKENRIVRGLIAGNYLITVKDITGCTATTNVKLENPEPIVALMDITPISCADERDGVIEVQAVSGGQGSPVEYSYSLTYPSGIKSAVQDNPIFDELYPGKYVVTVYTGYGCSEDFPAEIKSKTKVISSPGYIGRITCKIDNVKVTVDADGGASPYEYSTDGTTWQPSNLFEVGSGSYEFYVKDSEGCISEPSPIRVDDLEPLTLDIDTDSSITKTTCSGDSNAVLSVGASGGVGNYTYELVDASNTVISTNTIGTFNGVSVGTYKIRVLSGSDCPDGVEVSVDFTVTSPDPIEGKAIATDISCSGGDNGSITLTDIIGGNGDYTFRINTDPDNRFQDSPVFEDLVAGTYIVLVQDGKGCYKEFEVEVKEPDPITVTLSGSVQQQQCATDPAPSFTIEILGGTAPYNVSLNGIAPVTLPSGTNSYTFEDGKDGFTVLAGAKHFVLVTDKNNCRIQSPFKIETEPTLDLGFDLVEEYDCEGNGEFATISAVEISKPGITYSGISYTVFSSGYDDSKVDNSASAMETNSTGVFKVPANGQTYYVEGNYLGNTCKPVAKEIDVAKVDGKLGFITKTKADDVTITLNTIIVEGTGGTGTYEYSINGGPFGSDNVIEVPQTQTYTVTVKDLVTGCTYTDEFEGEFLTVTPPDYFTPDGDGINDYWYPVNIEGYHSLEVYIYDRYGRKLEVLNGTDKGWDGTYKGKPLPRGDYWYTIYYRELSGEEKKEVGHFTLYRKK